MNIRLTGSDEECRDAIRVLRAAENLEICSVSPNRHARDGETVSVYVRVQLREPDLLSRRASDCFGGAR